MNNDPIGSAATFNAALQVLRQPLQQEQAAGAAALSQAQQDAGQRQVAADAVQQGEEAEGAGAETDSDRGQNVDIKA